MTLEAPERDPASEFLSLASRQAQSDWIRAKLALPPRPELRQLSDGFRLPGREGPLLPAAVLIPVIAHSDELTVLLTLRTDQLPDHPGQISFPGGRREPGDRSAEETALRESREEIGLDTGRVTILGELCRYETVSGYEVTPLVGWVAPPYAIRLHPEEVADAFEVPLAHFLRSANYRRGGRIVAGRRREYFEVPYGERYIWGATAAMLWMLQRTVVGHA